MNLMVTMILLTTFRDEHAGLLFAYLSRRNY
jgi:hypothetical protein